MRTNANRALYDLSKPHYPSDLLAAVFAQVNVEIAKRSDVGKFVVLPKR